MLQSLVSAVVDGKTSERLQARIGEQNGIGRGEFQGQLMTQRGPLHREDARLSLLAAAGGLVGEQGLIAADVDEHADASVFNQCAGWSEGRRGGRWVMTC